MIQWEIGSIFINPWCVFRKYLNLHYHPEFVYKKVSSRVKLISCIWDQMSPNVAESIYQAMICRIVLYYYQLQLGTPKGTIGRLKFIQDRATKIASPLVKHQKLRNLLLKWTTRLQQRMCLSAWITSHLNSSCGISNAITMKRAKDETIPPSLYL